MADEILTETRGRVRLITLNRPEARNAVNSALGLALVAAIEDLDSDDGLTAKMGMDATRPLEGWKAERCTLPEEAIADARRRVEALSARARAGA